MKKLFFTSLVAVIAIGGAFGTNSSKVFTDYHYFDSSVCQGVSNLPILCGSGPEICTINGSALYDGSCSTPSNILISKMSE